MTDETGLPRRRGAQPGNTNALKHGYYSRVLDRAGRERLAEARALDATDLLEEVALLRERLSRLVEASPEHFDLLCKVAGQLTRTVATHFMMRGGAADRLFDATDAILEDIRSMLIIEGASE